MCRIINIDKPSFVIHKNVSSILDPHDFYSALCGEMVFRRKSYLSEYDKYIENTIVYDEKFHVLLAILKIMLIY
jgi:hypothetical protein